MRSTFLLPVLMAAACDGATSLSTESALGTDPTLFAQSIQLLQASGPSLGLSRADSVQLRGQLRDELGQVHTRFERQYRGLPVRGGDLIVHQATETGLTFSHELGAIDLDIRPTVAMDEAAYLGAGAFRGVRSEKAPRTALVVYGFEGPRDLRLAYEVITEGTASDGTPSVLHAFVDAHSGAVLGQYDEIETVGGTGKTLYSGTVGIEVTQNGSKFELVDGLRGGQKTTLANGAAITSTTTTFGDGTTANSASAGADAHFGAAKTWDYYKNVHGRNGIANDGKGAPSRVHYGNKYNNAFWSDGCFCMTYGDGDGRVLKTLVALDVAGHEMSHGVTSRTANLVYMNESGGLNEATSDIFGTAVEFYAGSASDPGDYLIGEKIAGASLGRGFLRSMSSPTDDGSSLDHYSKYTAGVDVHLSSGIGNNFFYLLAQGGTNKTSRKAVTGIGRAKAEKIWYRTLTVYLTSSSTFKAARTGSIKAAGDLYGATGAEASAVAAAWTAVGVN